MSRLKSPYTSILTGSRLCYGGDQRLFQDPCIRRCGCGLVAALDTLIYLKQGPNHLDIPFLDLLPGEGPISQSLYEDLALKLRPWIPLIYPVGIAPPVLAGALKLFIKANKLPLKASYSFIDLDIWQRIDTMLSADIPAVLAVGAAFPRLWSKDKLLIERADGAGTSRIKAHFVTVTALEGDRVELSSWGEKYLLERREFMRYRHESSIAPLCGTLRLELK